MTKEQFQKLEALLLLNAYLLTKADAPSKWQHPEIWNKVVKNYKEILRHIDGFESPNSNNLPEIV